MEKLLGVRPPDDVKGVLQDIHWAWGEFGYFPTYALGNLYSAQLWAVARPAVEPEIERGNLLPLRDWLRQKVHREGYRYPAEELVRRICGRGLTDDDFVRYLTAKYSELYRIAIPEERP
jgi:carboxypeptidase Taq